MTTFRFQRAATQWRTLAGAIAAVALTAILQSSPTAACGDACAGPLATGQTCDGCTALTTLPCDYCDTGAGAVTVAVIDSDGDGLTDQDETLYAADPANPDTDFDGILDGKEAFVYGTYPWTHDSDSDNVSDYRELFDSHTNPMNADTDGDGYSDSEELYRYGTDPNNPNSYSSAQGQR